MQSIIQANDIFNFSSYRNVLEINEKDIYANSPFRSIKSLSSSKKGSFFERLTKEFLMSQGFEVQSRDNSGHDLVAIRKGIRNQIEVKGSSLWGRGSQFRWSQIRPSQDYDIVCFVAMWPDKIEFLGATKKEVSDYVLEQDGEGNWVHNMHGGKAVNSGTFLIQGFPKNFSWMRPLEEALR
jgi:hypothetical protein